MRDSPNKTLGGTVMGWWESSIHADTGSAKKSRAQLRRAARPSEVLAIEATHELHSRIEKIDLEIDITHEHYPLRLALIASVLSGLNGHIDSSLPARFGQPSGDRRVLSEIRFQRILAATDDWELAIRLRRAMPIANRKANVATLGNDLFYWGEATRNRWCFFYFGAKTPNLLNTNKPTADIEVN